MAFTDLTDANLTTYVRRLINEPRPLIHSDADIVVWLNMGAQTMVQSGLGFEAADTTLVLASGVQDYPYIGTNFVFAASGAHSCERIEYMIYSGQATAAGLTESAVNTRSLIKIPPRLYRQLDSATGGEPKYWTDFGESVHIWPVPSGSEANNLVHIWYYKIFPAFVSGSIATLPKWLQEYPIWYAVAKAFEREGKFAQAQQYYSYFWSFIMFHRQDRLYKPVDSKDMMRLPDNTQFV